jgi:predicted DNA-binding transcriptional regulator YafY
MPTNNDALLRYHTIDKCLQNRYHKWTWEALAEKCTEALLEVHARPLKNTLSKRTIENDIKMMRGDHLGYNAPIKRKNGEYYYEDKSFSIRNATISKKDVQNMAFAIKMLNTYKGLHFFKEVEGLINRLEKSVHLQTYEEVQKIISFEQIPASTGQELITPLMEAILNKHVIKLSYKKFNTKEEKEYTFHPYFLKEYRNRWYILGWYEDGKYIKTFALDRITGFDPVLEPDYLLAHRPNHLKWFRA